jgi:tRNA nucleotidyltransferase/poly(A) polymerase
MSAPATPYLARLVALTPDPLYLVGGSVRDLLIGIRTSKDIDVLMPSGSEEVARRFADAIGGSFFILDEERKITRVLKQEGPETFQFDFTNFEGPDLHADLARRDFTINAMALDLRGFLSTGTLDTVIDRFDGRADIDRKLVRVSDPKVLDSDPLRLLRAVRFAATLGFSIDRNTADEIRRRAELIQRPSPERIREEFFLVLSQRGVGRHLLLMESLGLLRELLPELGPLKDFAPGRHHVYDIFTHSVKTAEYADAVLDDLPRLSPQHAGTVRAHLDEPLEQGVPRMAALRFSCLLHDIAKSETYSRDDEGDIHFYGHDQIGADRVRDICSRFRLSRATEAAVERLVRHHMRPLGLAVPNGPSKRALYRYCRDLKNALPESVVLALADAKATAEVMPVEGFTDTQRTVTAILDYYYGKFLKVEARPLVTGQDLIDRGMKPGPDFRRILEDIREKQAEGVLGSRDEAIRYLEQGNAS